MLDSLRKSSVTNRPQCNGKNERVNQTLVAKLRCKVNSTTKTPWTKLLEQVRYGYNNSPHDVTGFPPAYLMLGTLPYDSPLPNQSSKSSSYQEDFESSVYFCEWISIVDATINPVTPDSADRETGRYWKLYPMESRNNGSDTQRIVFTGQYTD
ncbi:retrovirus-related Pol polyprotein from transposon 17.6 [Trichonephila clavipes]|nr:retrovirus-related Pol polyprotein from transposon 17.6 [Trichonephila clavipes]